MSTPSTSDFKSPLERWLWKNRMRAMDLAEKTGVSKTVVSRLVHGKYNAEDSEAMDRIRKFTGLQKL